MVLGPAFGGTCRAIASTAGAASGTRRMLLRLLGRSLNPLKHYRGRLRLAPDGLLWYGHSLLAPSLSASRWEADKLQARIGTPDVAVVPIVAVVGATVPFGQLTAHDVTVIPAPRLPGLLRSPAAQLDAGAGAGGGRADQPPLGRYPGVDT
jgi:hypothetical protein